MATTTTTYRAPQIDQSLEGKRFVLVTCGPVPLRQHLYPIARRLQVGLGEHYDRYVDLFKEFERRQQARVCGDNLAAASRDRPEAATAAASAAAAKHQPTVTEAGDEMRQDSPPGSPTLRTTASTPLAQSPLSPGAIKPVANSDSSKKAAAPRALQQQISAGVRKRLEEILKRK